MKALVLAKGQGNRLGDLTKHGHEGLLPVAGVPLFSLVAVLAHSLITVAIFAYRASKHLYSADHSRNSGNLLKQDLSTAKG